MKKEKTIKLISIIVIIIILLILAGIAIAQLTKNGVLEKRKLAINKNYNDTEASYEIVSNTGTKYDIVIYIKNVSGIQKITCPNGIVIEAYNKTNIAIDYEIEDNSKYEFIIQSQNIEETFILDTNEMNNITISDTTSYLYPVLCIEGVEINKFVYVDTDEDLEKYYSLDNGVTWEKYEENVKISEETTIKAKTIVNNKITHIVSKKITLELADDALETTVYDGNEETYGCYRTTKYLNVDEGMQGRKINVLAYSGITGGYMTYVYSINSLEEEKQLVAMNSYFGKEATITIPSDCIKLKFYTQSNAFVKEIKICDEPVIEEIRNYPILTVDGVTNLISQINITYFPTSVKKLYKIDEGEWKEYEDIITVEVGKTVYAKGIDINGKETRIISECTASLESDALETTVYDGKEDTYGCKGTTQYLIIDEDMQGRKINVLAYSGITGGYMTYVYSINSLEEEKQLVAMNSYFGKEATITIPSDCKKLKFYTQSNAVIKEIKIIED